MHSVRSLLLALAFSLGGISHAAPASPYLPTLSPQPQADLATPFTLRVVNGETGAPVPAAEVLWLDRRTHTERLNPRDGSWTYDHEEALEREDRRVQLSEDGTVTFDVPRGGAFLLARADGLFALAEIPDRAQELTVALERDVTLRVRAVDPDGVPVRDTRTMLLAGGMQSVDSGNRNLLMSTVTDDEGFATFHHLQRKIDGLHNLSRAAFQMERHMISLEVIGGNPVAVPLEYGAWTGIEPVLLSTPPVAYVELLSPVTPAEPWKPTQVLVALASDEASASERYRGSFRSGRDGVTRFTAHVGAKLTVRVRPMDTLTILEHEIVSPNEARATQSFGPFLASGLVPVLCRPTVGGESLPPGSSVRATLHDSRNQRLEWPARVTLSTARADEEGRFRMWIRPEHAALKGATLSVSIDTPELRFSPLVVPLTDVDQATGSIDLGEMSFERPSVLFSGRVVDEAGRPWPGLRLEVQHDDATSTQESWRAMRNGTLFVRTAEDGSFEVRADSEARRFKVIPLVDGRRSEPSREIERGERGVLVSIGPKARLEAQLVLDTGIPASRINANLYVEPSGDGSFRRSVQCDIDGEGRLSATGIPMGPARLRLQLEPAARGSSINSIPLEAIDFDVTGSLARLPEPVDLRGLVRRVDLEVVDAESGEPLPDAVLGWLIRDSSGVVQLLQGPEVPASHSLLLPATGAELLVLNEGHLATFVDNPSSAERIELQRAPRLTIALDPAGAPIDGPWTATVNLTPKLRPRGDRERLLSTSLHRIPPIELTSNEEVILTPALQTEWRLSVNLRHASAPRRAHGVILPRSNDDIVVSGESERVEILISDEEYQRIAQASDHPTPVPVDNGEFAILLLDESGAPVVRRRVRMQEADPDPRDPEKAGTTFHGGSGSSPFHATDALGRFRVTTPREWFDRGRDFLRFIVTEGEGPLLTALIHRSELAPLGTFENSGGRTVDLIGPVVLRPLSPIVSGELVDERGQPIEDAILICEAIRTVEDPEAGNPVERTVHIDFIGNSSKTGADGSFALYTLEPDEELIITAIRSRAKDGSAAITMDAPVRIKRGDTRVRVEARRLCSLEVGIVPPPGFELNELSFMLLPAEFPGRPQQGTTFQTGDSVVYLRGYRPGMYTLQIRLNATKVHWFSRDEAGRVTSQRGMLDANLLRQVGGIELAAGDNVLTTESAPLDLSRLWRVVSLRADASAPELSAGLRLRAGPNAPLEWWGRHESDAGVELFIPPGSDLELAYLGRIRSQSPAQPETRRKHAPDLGEPFASRSVAAPPGTHSVELELHAIPWLEVQVPPAAMAERGSYRIVAKAQPAGKVGRAGSIDASEGWAWLMGHEPWRGAIVAGVDAEGRALLPLLPGRAHEVNLYLTDSQNDLNLARVKSNDLANLWQSSRQGRIPRSMTPPHLPIRIALLELREPLLIDPEFVSEDGYLDVLETSLDADVVRAARTRLDEL